MVLLLEVARAVVRASGRQLGITCRRSMQGETSHIPGSMVWVCLLAEAQAPLRALWRKPASGVQLNPFFGGSLCGDQVGRVRVRILGKGPVSGGVPRVIGDAMWAPVAPKRVFVRVEGCPIEWALPNYGWKGVRAELPAVFGAELAGVGLGWVKASPGRPDPPRASLPAPRDWAGRLPAVRSQGLPDC